MKRRAARSSEDQDKTNNPTLFRAVKVGDCQPFAVGKMPEPRPKIVVPPARDTNSMSAAEIGAEVGLLLDALADRVENPDNRRGEEAVSTLLALLVIAVTHFDKVCADNPARFLALARGRENWPTMFHRHPGLNRRTQKRMREIELGTQTELNYRHKSFSLDTPANKVVLNLYHLVKLYRISGTASGKSLLTGEFASVETESKVNAWVRDVGETLPDLSRDTWKEWDKKTRGLFLLHYGEDFEVRPDLAVLTRAVRQRDRFGKVSRSHCRDAIFKALSDAWRSISAFGPG